MVVNATTSALSTLDRDEIARRRSRILERTGLTHQQLAQRIGATERDVREWERVEIPSDSRLVNTVYLALRGCKQ